MTTIDQAGKFKNSIGWIAENSHKTRRDHMVMQTTRSLFPLSTIILVPPLILSLLETFVELCQASVSNYTLFRPVQKLNTGFYFLLAGCFTT